VLVALALVAILMAAGLLAFGPVATVRRVEVTGVGRLSAAQVRAAAGVPSGVPLLRLDAVAVARRVAALPAVAEVDVQRRYPQTVRLRITERQPAAVLAQGDGFALVDRAGVTFAQDPAAPPGVPLLDVASPDLHDPGTAAALSVVGELPSVLQGQVRSVAAPSPSTVIVALRGGATVMWGDSRDGDRKAAVLTALLRTRPANRYDVSTPDVVTTR
jgi:cell division protein FtsQ